MPARSFSERDWSFSRVRTARTASFFFRCFFTASAHWSVSAFSTPFGVTMPVSLLPPWPGSSAAVAAPRLAGGAGAVPFVMSMTGSALAGNAAIPSPKPQIVAAMVAADTAATAVRTLQIIVIASALGFRLWDFACRILPVGFFARGTSRIDRPAELYTGPPEPCLPDPWQEWTKPREVPVRYLPQDRGICLARRY